METRFSGTSTHKVDPKGRVSIPSSFRKVLDNGDPDREPGTNPRIRILYGDPREPWLTCHSMASFAEISAVLDAMNESHEHYEALISFYYSHAETLPIDDSGRLILTRQLRARVGVDGDAVFTGRGKTFRIYSPEAPAEAVDPLATLIATLPQGKSMASILHEKRQSD